MIELDAGYGLLLLPKGSGAPSPLVIYFHGNGEVAYWSIESFRSFLDLNVAVLLLEYPGYGGASGSPSQESIEIAALSAYDKMAARPDIDQSAIVAYGRSIGGGPATGLAAKRPVSAIVLESTFFSLESLVAEMGYPSFLLRDDFNNGAVIERLEIPLFLFHGRRDRVIPFSHSQRLASIAPRATFSDADCGHNDCARPLPGLLDFLSTELALEAGIDAN